MIACHMIRGIMERAMCAAWKDICTFQTCVTGGDLSG